MAWAQNVNLVPRREREKQRHLEICMESQILAWWSSKELFPYFVSKSPVKNDYISPEFNLSLKKQLKSPTFLLSISFLYPVLLSLPQGNKWTSNKYAQYLPDFPQTDSHGNQTEKGNERKIEHRKHLLDPLPVSWMWKPMLNLPPWLGFFAVLTTGASWTSVQKVPYSYVLSKQMAMK